MSEVIGEVKKERWAERAWSMTKGLGRRVLGGTEDTRGGLEGSGWVALVSRLRKGGQKLSLIHI
eukprot:4552418-Prorocentrum_lima.AAC.1